MHRNDRHKNTITEYELTDISRNQNDKFNKGKSGRFIQAAKSTI